MASSEHWPHLRLRGSGSLALKKHCYHSSKVCLVTGSTSLPPAVLRAYLAQDRGRHNLCRGYLLSLSCPRSHGDVEPLCRSTILSTNSSASLDRCSRTRPGCSKTSRQLLIAVRLQTRGTGPFSCFLGPNRANALDSRRAGKSDPRTRLQLTSISGHHPR